MTDAVVTMCWLFLVYTFGILSVGFGMGRRYERWDHHDQTIKNESKQSDT